MSVRCTTYWLLQLNSGLKPTWFTFRKRSRIVKRLSSHLEGILKPAVSHPDNYGVPRVSGLAAEGKCWYLTANSARHITPFGHEPFSSISRQRRYSLASFPCRTTGPFGVRGLPYFGYV